jgi:Mlc titration factor MtfA (ptsG expression regulator)
MVDGFATTYAKSNPGSEFAVISSTALRAGDILSDKFISIYAISLSIFEE